MVSRPLLRLCISVECHKPGKGREEYAMAMVAPSLLSADFTNFAAALDFLEQAGADMVHCDVMDGSFVPNISFGQPMIAALRKKTKLPLDVHLMVQEPGRYVGEFAAAGADIITVHAEACTHLHRTLQQIKETGTKAGVALNPATPLSVLEYVMDYVDLILCMSVNPGFGGQKFIPAVFEKVRKAAKMILASKRDILLEVDGGVNEENAPELRKAGATLLVAGNAVFKNADSAAAIRHIRGDSLL